MKERNDKERVVEAMVDDIDMQADGGTERAEGVSDAGEPEGKKIRKPLIAILAGVAMAAAIGIGVAVASQPAAEVESKPVAAQEAEEPAKKVKATLTVEAEGAEEAVGKMRYTVVDSKGEEAVKPKEAEIGKKVDLGRLASGRYTIEVAAYPVLEDGSTYKVDDDKNLAFDVLDSEIDVTLKLVYVPMEEMTKEQLEVSADDIGDNSGSANGSYDAGSGSSGGDAGGSRSGGLGRNPGNTGGGSSAPDQPKPKVWVVDQAAWDEWVVDVPAQPAVPEQGHWVPTWWSGGITFYSYEEARAYSVANKVSIANSQEYVVDVPAQPAVPEQGHWVHHDEVGHWE